MHPEPILILKMGICVNISEILGNNLHVTQMSHLFLNFILNTHRWLQKATFSWIQELRTQNMGNLKIYQQDQSCAQALLLTAVITASSDSRPSFHPILVTDKLQCSLPNLDSTSTSQTFPRSSTIFYCSMICFLTMLTMQKTMLLLSLVLYFLSFLVSLVKSGASFFQSYSSWEVLQVLLHVFTARTRWGRYIIICVFI